MKRLVWIFLVFSTIPSVAQRFLPDSLHARFNHLPQDSVYVDGLNKLASSYLKTSPNVARSVASHVMDVALNIKYTRGYARALTLMGNSYWYEGIYEFAQNYYLLAARQYQNINDSIGLGQTYNNIGEVYKKLNENDKALEYLLRSRELKKRDSSTTAITLYNIGELYIKLGQLEKARTYIRESFAFSTREKNERVIAYNYWSFAAIKVRENDLKGALEDYIRAEKIWDRTGETRSLIQTYQDMAEVHRLLQQYDSAEFYLRKAINLAGRIKVADLQVRNFERFARLDSLRGNYSRAFFYLTKHNLLKDSVYNLLKAEQIARLQTIYETETREKENQELRTEKQLRDSQLALQRTTLIAISIVLLLAGVVSWILYRQRKKIAFQKEAIEIQATALQKLNDELQNFNKTLEARIEERTLQLTVQNTRLAEFTFINAHKLRAPVASILGLINLLHEVDECEKEEILGHLRKCSEELDTTIRAVSRNLEDAIVKEGKYSSIEKPAR